MGVWAYTLDEVPLSLSKAHGKNVTLKTLKEKPSELYENEKGTRRTKALRAMPMVSIQKSLY